MWISGSSQEYEMTEIERLEFNRRIDIANAVIKDAIRVFNQLTELDNLIESKSRTTKISWYLIVMLIGVAVDYFMPDNGHRISWGEYIAWIALVVWSWKFFEIQYLKSRREHCNERLHELDVIWSGGTGLLTFWALGGFAKLLEHDRENDKFRAWWKEQLDLMLERVQLR
jgi:hypothetical protein